MSPGLTAEHKMLLDAAGISTEVAEAAGVRSVTEVEAIPEHARWCRATPGIVFPWRSPNGDVTEQYRPDHPVTVNGDEHPRKYLFPANRPPVLNVHPAMVDRVAGDGPIVIVEGTKQTLAAVTAAADTNIAVVGVAGCYGWLSEGQPIADMSAIPWSGRDMVVIFDADIASNPNVHQAAQRLGAELEIRGARAVRYATLPGGDSQGLDDVLASRAVDGSTKIPFTTIVAKAGKLPRKPPAVKNRFFGADGLKVAKLTEAVRDRHDLAVDPGDRLLVYADGVYTDGRHIVTATIGDLLVDAYRPLHARAAVELLTARLVADGLIITGTATTPIVNVSNGLLNPFTGTLTAHTAEHLSLVQFPVPWQPDATCPRFDAWLDEVTDGRGDDLLEATAQVLDMRGHRQRKAIFTHGPTRSGKSTLLRIVESLVGPSARSAVTLQDLAVNRFAAADLFGRVLNTANELSAAHVDDLAMFKAVTGDDPVRAERKYGQPFTFRNKALFMFAANEIPTVSEVSGAYLARIRPFRFPHSYEGREDPSIETAMMAELPGVLVRLVAALCRFEERGGYADDDKSRSALDDFARHSDRVRLFLHETTTADPDGFTERGELFAAFERWAQQNRRQVLGRHRFYEHVATAGYREAKRRGARGFVGLDLRLEAEWGAPDLDEPVDEPVDDPIGGQKGQNIHTPASRARKVEGEEEEGRVKAGCEEPAPSAPRDEREVMTW